jgi:hypothetical protein
MARFKDVEWVFRPAGNGSVETWEQAQVAVLMDIRDELKRLNGLLACPNFIGIPATLRSIDRKVTKPKRRKAGK